MEWEPLRAEDAGSDYLVIIERDTNNDESTKGVVAFHGVVSFRAKRKKKGITKGKSFCDRRLTSAKGPELVGVVG